MKLMLVALLAATTVSAECQVPTFDRNFQRLDHIHTIPGRQPGPLLAVPKKAPLDYWKLGPNVAFPSAAASYGAALIFADEPLGMNGEHLHTFSSTTSYSYNDPSGGAITRIGSSTLSYQVTGDLNNALTFGSIDSYTDGTDFSTAGNASVTELLDPGYHWSFTPTLTYNHAKSAGQIQDAWGPDFMVTWVPAKSPLIGAVDYAPPSLASGQAVQLDGFYTFGFKPNDPLDDARTSLKVGVQFTTGGLTTFSIGLAIKLGGLPNSVKPSVATVL